MLWEDVVPSLDQVLSYSIALGITETVTTVMTILTKSQSHVCLD
jgi:hypothetical protein